MRKATAIVTRTGVVIVLAIFAAAALYPILFMFLTSFKTSVQYTNDPLALPPGFAYIQNFVAMFNSFNVPGLLLNTITYIALAAIISLTVSIPAAYALAKLRFPLRNLFFITIIASMVIPAITYIIPDYVLMSNLDLVDTLWSVVLLWATTSVPGSIFLLTSLMRGLPNDILEATRVDGANYLQLMIRIVIPISAPGIITITIFNVTSWWNDLLIPLVFLQSDVNKTLTVAVATIVGRYNTDYPLLLTGLFMASLPPILIYIFLQRYIRRGLVIGAIK
ncbi:sugar ABC transporter permease [Dictyobacter sp. S3.2.2.5]|uniref:Sugar ABC transporter permease n=1 Tax=Dictyobacter halimunensis TaxID=3026934 RepID=A0ABQ6FLV0_9CHLR|nr:sugar ABC transporter permease [Dictyobacter sp. S3.2.2.5]